MPLFKKRTADPRRPALVRAFGGWGGGEWPRSYEAQVREAYLGNPVAQRAVRIVAEGAAGVPVYAADGFERAEALVSGAVIEAVAAQLLLHGNAFLQIVGDAEGVPAELFALRPERVTIESDGGGWPAAYLYRAGEVVQRIAAKDGAGRPGVIHLKGLNPIDDHYGTGSLGAAGAAVAAHNAAAKWNKALLDNAARPSGALVHEGDGVLTPEAHERLRVEMEAGFSGSGNAGRPMLLEGGLKWQAMSLTPADMDFVGLKASAAREIALAFGVPPMLLGLPGDSTYANYSEANRALWRLTIVPLLAKILAGVSAGLAAWWPGVSLEADLDRVPALASDRAALWAQVTAADFLTVAEKRAMLGFAENPPRHGEVAGEA